MADVFDPEVEGEPGDPPLLADAADLGDIGLHDVEGAARQPGNETLAPGQHLPAGDRDRALTAQLAEILEGVGLQRLLEPADIIILQHLRRAQRPFQAMGPIGIARPGIDEEPGIRPRRFARRAHDGLIQLAVAGAPEGAPADLEGAKSLRPILGHGLAHGLGTLHEQRAIGLHLAAVHAAEQPADGLARRLAQDIPEGDVDAADGVGQRAAAPHPEAVLMQGLRDALGLERILAAKNRLEHLERRRHETVIGEDAAVADNTGIRMHGDQAVHGIFGPDLGRPASLRALAEQGNGDDGADPDRTETGGDRRFGRLAHGLPPLPATRLADGARWSINMWRGRRTGRR